MAEEIGNKHLGGDLIITIYLKDIKRVWSTIFDRTIPNGWRSNEAVHRSWNNQI
jgi:hypothetical protein